jgi:pimeloyl-ACP methyl ester carboxylesterase
MLKLISLLCAIILLSACKKDDYPTLSEINIPILNTHALKAKTFTDNNSTYLVVFESGLGDGSAIWEEKKTANQIAKHDDILIYSRAGYEQSTIDNNLRDVDRLRQELEIAINQTANGRKVILIGHSLGGLIIRDYAIKNPTKTAALLFIDSSHELYNQPTQLQEDEIYNAFLSTYGINFGATKEAQALIESLAYSSALPNLPNIPTIVLTSMKQDNNNNTSDQTNNKTRQDWYNAHEALKTGVTDFTHIQTLVAGHYIMIEEPNLVLDNFNLLKSKLP